MKSNDYLQLIVIIFYFGVFVYGVLNFKKLEFPTKLLCFFILFLCITETISLVSLKSSGNNLLFFHVLPYFHHGFISVLYYKFTNKSKQQRKFILFSTLAFFVFALANSLFYQQLNQVPLLTILVQFLLILVYTILHYYNLLSQIVFSPIKYNSSFWFNTGNVVYYTFLLYWWIVMILFCKNDSDFSDIFLFVWMSNIVLCICYLLALITNVKKSVLNLKYPYYGYH